MTRKIIIYDDGPQGPQPGSRAAARFIALTLTLVTLWAVLAVLGKVPSFDLGEPDTAQAQDAASSSASELLKQARAFDGLGYKYGGGHDPEQWLKNNKAGSREGLDCSGLIDVAVYIVSDHKINSSQVAEGFRHDKHWTTIGERRNRKTDLSRARLGDIVWRIPPHGGSIAHAAIVVSNDTKSRVVTVFEAYGSHVSYGEQIRQGKYAYDDMDGASRFKG